MTTPEPLGQQAKVRHISTARRWPASVSGPPPEDAGAAADDAGEGSGESTAQLIPLFDPGVRAGHSMRSARSRAAGWLLLARRRSGEDPDSARRAAAGESERAARRGRVAAALGLGWILGLTLMIRATRQPPGRRRSRG